MKRVDYDQLSAHFDDRYAFNPLKGVAEALVQLVESSKAQRILEAGCGTGRWLRELLPRAAFLCGVDPSMGMLSKAPRGHLVAATANQLPFRDRSFDLIFCVNAIHHFGDPAKFIHSSAQLLKAGGTLAIFGIDPRLLLGRWFVYDYFDGTFETDLARFPSYGSLLDSMAASGFTEAAWRIVERIGGPKTGAQILSEQFLRKDSCSQLALLTDEAYAEGLRRIEAAARDEKSEFAAHLFIAMISGRHGTM